MLTVYLKAGRERSVLQGNPWIFSGSIERTDGAAPQGTPCIVRDRSGRRLGCGYYNDRSAITVRILKWGDGSFDDDALTAAIRRAISLRKPLDGSATDSYRMVNSEGDFLPGLVVDRIGGGIVIQILTAGMERMRESLIRILAAESSPAFIYERSDTESRSREGLAESEGLLFGALPRDLAIRENGLVFGADIVLGQKTGFFLDQRDNRALLRTCTAGKRVCDCFCYTGGFTVSALAGEARSVEAVDQSENALQLLRDNVIVNGFEEQRVVSRAADVFQYLREPRDAFDCIILDPPKFARHPGEVERASRGYKDINLLACKNIAPGGMIFTFSCSHAVDARLFRQIVFAAVADSGRRFQLLHTLTAGFDHPVNMAHKEGDYLKGLVLRAEA
jgi:23S rRNA (cytosine1962-C5)-methyltransferase